MDTKAHHAHQEVELPQFAFDQLTYTGAEIFSFAYSYILRQKKDEYERFRKPLMCASNVSYVLQSAGIPISYEHSFSVPGLLHAIRDDGGTLFQFPLYNGGNRDEIIDATQRQFPDGIPTGAIVAGCTYPDCESEDVSQAHVGIIGDKNHHGDMMIYHNNWYRPNTNGGKRSAYMVSLTNLYDTFSPREWMPTPWINIRKNSDGEIEYIHSALPEIDDLNPFNGNFYITIAIPRQIQEEVDGGHILPHHVHNSHNNIHQKTLLFDQEHNRIICRSKKPLRTINAREYPGGPRNTKIYNTLSQNARQKTFLYTPFEFLILDKITIDTKTWYSIRVHDLKSYFGGKELPDGEIWITANQAICKTKKEWLTSTP